MTTLRQAVQEYVQMRRNLGFKLHEAGKGLVDFMRFMEQHRASHITQALALAWAQQPSHAQPAHWAQRLAFVRGFARYRSATDPRTPCRQRRSAGSVRRIWVLAEVILVTVVLAILDLDFPGTGSDLGDMVQVNR